MKLSYQHANPYDGNESFLLRFDELGRDHSPCLLVDSGNDVDVDELLGEGDYLVAILLTHAHLDHYRTLPGNLRDGAPVYAASDTARILETVLEEGRRNYDLGETAPVIDALEAVDGWKTVVGDVRIHPLPAGHAPGAAGFLVEFDDGGDPHHLLVTGDFTRRRTAGYPGLDVGGVDVEAVFLAGATADGVEATLTEVVGTAVERARAGSTTLLAASGLAGVHLAYLLGHVAERVDGPPVTVVGQTSKLYEELGYDVPNLTSTPTFASPTEVLAPGTVTVGGPEVPVEGSTGRLFDYVRSDPGATLLQVTGGATDPVEGGECTVYAHALSNHPTEATVDGVVESLAPAEVVITHQSSRAADRFKDRYDALTWATDDQDEYVIYEGGWLGPPWVHQSTTRSVLAGHLGPRLDPPDDLPTPTRGDVDLAAEGLNVGALDARFRGSPEVTGGTTDAGTKVNRDGGTVTPTGTTEANPDTATGAASGAETGEPVGFAEVERRLERIEAKVDGPTVRVRVVDAGDGVTLLRVLDAEAALEDGAELTLGVRHGRPDDGEESDGGEDRD